MSQLFSLTTKVVIRTVRLEILEKLDKQEEKKHPKILPFKF